MQWKISVFLLVAMLCLAFTGAAAAEDVKCCWEKPCGTEVEQCDDETTFVLTNATDAKIVKTSEGYFYVDMDSTDGDRIAVNDVRLTKWHNNRVPNTLVEPGAPELTGDNGQIIATYDPADVIKYMDLNGNDKFDIYDPVYFDVLGASDVASDGDIRLTDAVPVSPVRYVDSDNPQSEGAILDRSEYEGLESWSRVADGDADFGAELNELPSGEYAKILAWVDADNDAAWSVGDKLYVNQYDENHTFKEDFVTIGDTRLYIPADDPCIPDCGTKVVQGDHDVTYALSMFDEIQLAKSTQCNAVYLDVPDMSGNLGTVSHGDVRLSAVTKTYAEQTFHYPANTKVRDSDEADFNDDLFEISNNTVKFMDIDGILGYSLGDPLYLDLDTRDSDEGEVSDMDIRLTASPIYEYGVYQPAEFGEAWSRVDATPGDKDADAEMELKSLDLEMDLYDILGYVDSDCTGTWTCSDKLYLQQYVVCMDDGCEITQTANNHGYEQYNKFVTVGDLRIYEPFGDERSIYEGTEEWYDCGTKVEFCDKDSEFALAGFDVSDRVAYWNADGVTGFNPAEDVAYIDMDCDMNVSAGDIRLTDFSNAKGDFYYNNTKVVCCEEAEDADVGTDLIEFTDPESFDKDLLEWLDGSYNIMVFDSDCSGSWTCQDALYLQYEDAERCMPVWENMFVTHKDVRLFIPPDMICDQNGGNNGDQCPYDLNEDGTVNIDDVMIVVNAWGTSGEYDFTEDGTVNIDDVMVIVNNWGPCIV